MGGRAGRVCRPLARAGRLSVGVRLARRGWVGMLLVNGRGMSMDELVVSERRVYVATGGITIRVVGVGVGARVNITAAVAAGGATVGSTGHIVEVGRGRGGVGVLRPARARLAFVGCGLHVRDERERAMVRREHL